MIRLEKVNIFEFLNFFSGTALAKQKAKANNLSKKWR